jgi:hypothetical protein
MLREGRWILCFFGGNLGRSGNEMPSSRLSSLWNITLLRHQYLLKRWRREAGQDLLGDNHFIFVISVNVMQEFLCLIRVASLCLLKLQGQKPGYMGSPGCPVGISCSESPFTKRTEHGASTICHHLTQRGVILKARKVASIRKHIWKSVLSAFAINQFMAITIHFYDTISTTSVSKSL